MSTEATLLIEVGTEELPPQHLEKYAITFAQSISQSFKELGVSTSQVEHFVTPRRIAARLYQVPSEQPARMIQKRGPALASAFDAKGNPTPATQGFARSCKVEIEQLRQLETPQGTYLVYEQKQSGQTLQQLLPSVVENALNAIPGKRMRWGEGAVEFLRPIHWLTVVHGTKAIPIKVFNLTASNTTHGHRFHAPQALTITHADNYLNLLHDAKVIADHAERKEIIAKAIHKLAEKNSGHALIEPELLEQVTGLVEWPVPLYAHFDKAFLEVPQEALISSMQNHQKCFAMQSVSNKLLPIFILISNTDAHPPTHIIQGNERVMHARLADAKFFYDQDRKTPLASRLERLKNMIFQKKLGTLYEKCHRVSKLASQIAKLLQAPAQYAERAGKLCKADLLTEMVFEFPELQGIMGYYYALNDGEPEEVAVAIRESYLPRFAKDILPRTQTGIALALADRLDSLIGIFGIGQMPTGDKDPFGLRRQALGIIRILVENALPLDLEHLCQMARHGYGNIIDDQVVPQVVSFCFERFRAFFFEQGLSVQTLDAVMANNPTQPYDCSLRARAVDHFQTLPEAQNLAAANKRVRNILQKNGIIFSLQRLPEIYPNLCVETAELALYEAIEQLKGITAPLLANAQYQEALIALARLQKPADAFFDEVMVMTEDETLRKNRINLLCHLYALFMKIADISKLAL